MGIRLCRSRLLGWSPETRAALAAWVTDELTGEVHVDDPSDLERVRAALG